MDRIVSREDSDLERARMLLQMGKPDRAATMLKETLSRDPDNSDVESTLAFALFQMGENSSAQHHFINALARDPQEPWTHFWYSIMLHEQGKDTQAEHEVLTAIRLLPVVPEFHAFYAWLLYPYGQVEKAEAVARNALRLDPENEMALLLLGQKNVEDFDSIMAQETYLRTLRYNPNSPEAHRGMAQTHLMQNRLEDALEEAREALRLEPGDSYAMNTYLTAVKAKHPLYAMFWRWSLLCHRLGRSGSLFLIFGLWILYQVLRTIRQTQSEFLIQYPFLDAMLHVVMVGYILFCIYTWVANPIFSFLARRGYLK